MISRNALPHGQSGAAFGSKHNRALVTVSLLRFVALTGIALGAACGRPSAVHYRAIGSITNGVVLHREPGSTVDSVRWLTVSRANGRYRGAHGEVLWTVASESGGARVAPDSLRYAVAPAGFTTGIIQPLSPGDYEIAVQVGTHTTVSRFTIENNGQIAPER